MNEVERLRGLVKFIDYIDNCIGTTYNRDREYMEYMLKKKSEGLKLAIELSMSIIIKKHC